MSGDMRSVLSRLDELPAPDLWGEIESRAADRGDGGWLAEPETVVGRAGGEFRRARGSLIAAAVFVAVAVTALLVVLAGGDEDSNGLDVIDRPLETVPVSLPSSTTIPVADTASGTPLVFELVPDVVPWFANDPAVWFNDALFAIEAGRVVRTPDGFDWETVADLNSLGARGWGELLVSGDQLLAVADATWSESDGRAWKHEGDNLCALPGAAAGHVAVSADGEQWSLSQVPSPPAVESVLELGGCVSVGVSGLAGGGRFILATDLREVWFDEVTYAARLLADLQPDLDISSVNSYPGEAGSEPGRALFYVNGELTEIAFNETEFAAAQRAFDDFVAEESGSAGDPTGSWATSTDGISWAALEPSGPAVGFVGFFGAATSGDGFYLLNSAAETIEFSSDFVNWEVLEEGIDSFPTLVTWGDEVVWLEPGRVVGTDRVVLPAGLGAEFGQWSGGDFGLFGTDNQTGEVIFADDSGWERWTPTQFGGLDPPRVAGMGVDFVLLAAEGGTPADEVVFFVARRG